MTEAIETDQREAEFRIPPERPEGWEALEIVYTRYTRDAAGNAVADPGSFVVCHKKIEAFIRDLLDGKPLPHSCYTRKRHEDDPERGGPTDTYVGCKSYVVIELDRSTGWQFAKGRPAVTTWRDYGNTNWGLRHVMPEGILPENENPNGDGCRIAYFGVYERGDFQRQAFHLNVVSGSQLTEPVQIDPDIPNDGGRFPLTDRTPCRGTQQGAPHCRP